MNSITQQFLAAAQQGDLPALEAAIAGGADLNDHAPLSYDGTVNGVIALSGGKTALHLAVEANHRAIVERLVAAGADPNRVGDGSTFFTGEAALHVAARRGDVEMVALLLKASAKPHLKQSSRPNVPGKVALQLAAAKGHIEVGKLLLQTPGPATKTAAGAALCDAAEFGREAFTRLLLQHGATQSKTNSYGWTPLMTACFHGFPGVARILLDAGADPKAPGRKGHTPLYMVVHGAYMAPENNRDVESPRDHNGVALLLMQRGARPDEGLFQERTPRVWAEQYAEMSSRVRELVPVLAAGV